MYTLHTAERTQTEAEAECQRGGGHLASVASEEVNELLRRVAGSEYFVWLGARKESGVWGWTDNSAWEYTKLNDMRMNDKCIGMNTEDGTWYAPSGFSTIHGLGALGSQHHQYLLGSKMSWAPIASNRKFEAVGAQLISGAQQILMVLGAQGAREPRTMKCTKAVYFYLSHLLVFVLSLYIVHVSHFFHSICLCVCLLKNLQQKIY